MGDAAELVRPLLAEADAVGPGPAQVALVEEAVRVADAHGEERLAFDARKRLFNAALAVRRCDLAGVTFAWCLGWFDARPDRPADPGLLWDYRRVILAVSNFPEVGRAELLRMTDDMGRRYAAAGYSPRRVHLTRMKLALDLGDEALARRAWADWAAAPHGLMEGRWDDLDEADFLTFVGDDAAALALAERVLRTYDGDDWRRAVAAGHALLPLAKAGRPDEAAALYRRLARWERPPAGDAWTWSMRLAFLAATGNAGAGLAFVRATWPRVLGHVDPLGQLHYDLAALGLFAALGGRETVPVELPDGRRTAAEAPRLAAPQRGRLGRPFRRPQRQRLLLP